MRRAGSLAAAAAVLAAAALLAGGRGRLGAFCGPSARRVTAAGRPRVARFFFAPPGEQPATFEPLTDDEERGGPARVEPARAEVELDPTGEIAGAVDSLNDSGNLNLNINRSAVVEPLSRLDLPVAMSILSDVRDRAGAITNPTGFIMSAAARAARKQVALDPTGEIARAVDSLNDSGNLNDPIDWGVVVGPLSWLDLPDALSILNRMRDRADAITNPTGYIVAAAMRAADASEVNVEIAKKVDWLNTFVFANLTTSIFKDVAKPLSRLGLQSAMRILSQLEEAPEEFRDPTNFILASVARAPGGHKQARKEDPEDPTRELAKQVGWLNEFAGLQHEISWRGVVEPLSRVGFGPATRILQRVKEKAEQIDNPTGYIYASATRLLEQEEDAEIDLDPTGQISRQVGWLNRHGGLKREIFFSKVVTPLSRLKHHTVMLILQSVRDQAEQIRNPTSFIQAQAARQLKREEEDAEIDLDPTGQISRQVGWLNRNGGLKREIFFSEVVGPLSRLDVSAAMAILQHLQKAETPVDNPTYYIQAAALRRAKEKERTVPSESAVPM